jgi:hypothetical protein
MANVDSLLDLGDPDESCPPPAASEAPGAASLDPFDPFAMDEQVFTKCQCTAPSIANSPLDHQLLCVLDAHL